MVRCYQIRKGQLKDDRLLGHRPGTSSRRTRTFVRRFTLKDVRNWNNLPTKTYSKLGVCLMSNMDVLGSKTPSLAINGCVFVCVSVYKSFLR